MKWIICCWHSTYLEGYLAQPSNFRRKKSTCKFELTWNHFSDSTKRQKNETSYLVFEIFTGNNKRNKFSSFQSVLSHSDAVFSLISVFWLCVFLEGMFGFRKFLWCVLSISTLKAFHNRKIFLAYLSFPSWIGSDSGLVSNVFIYFPSCRWQLLALSKVSNSAKVFAF